MAAFAPVKVFIVYAQEDKPVRDKLLRQLRPLSDNGEIDLWSDHEIKPGMVWDDEIRQRLVTSELIILLISDDFFASDYIRNIEWPEALERHSRGEVRLLPVIARHCGWEDVTSIASLQVLPTGGRPVISKEWDSPDEAYRDVFQGVKAALRDLRGMTATTRTVGNPPASAHTSPFDLSVFSQQKEAIQPQEPTYSVSDPRKPMIIRFGILLGLVVVVLAIWGIMKWRSVPEVEKNATPVQLTAPNSTVDQPKTFTPADNTTQKKPESNAVKPPEPSQQEETDWAIAQKENTIGIYLKFLQNYPKGVHSVEATKTLNDLQNQFNVYMTEAERLYKEGKRVKAKIALEKAKKLAPAHPKVAELEKKL